LESAGRELEVGFWLYVDDLDRDLQLMVGR
jgi:hypothetical protein